MDIISRFIAPDSAAYAVLILSSVIALGIAIGSIPIFKVRIGIAGVLFSGLLFGHLHWSFDMKLIEFIREFGLILFVYSVGLQVGPGFLSSLKKDGLKLNFLAALTVLMSFGLVIIYIMLHWIPSAAGAGIFSGSTTNTPSLGAAQEAIKLKADFLLEDQKLPSLAYAIVYPFGIMGLILSMILTRTLGRINLPDEVKKFDATTNLEKHSVLSLSLNIENSLYAGQKIKDLPIVKNGEVVISRIMHNHAVSLVTPETKLAVGDIIHAVGPKDKIAQLEHLVGSISPIHLRADVQSELMLRKMIVTHPNVAGKTIREISLSLTHDVTITRVIRNEIEFTAVSNLSIQMGDKLMAVGEKEALNQLAQIVGDMPKELRHPRLIPIFVGIAFGLIIGHIPIQLPGVPAPVKLGIAGGPLIAAILFSNIYRVGPIIWYMPESANWMLREIGIALFLSAVGLKAGDQFVQTLVNGPGLLWMGLGIMTTLIPLFITIIISRKIFKLNFLTLCGVLAGTLTNPPGLAFANSQAQSNAVLLAYANVYPLVMIMRVICAQLIILIF